METRIAMAIRKAFRVALSEAIPQFRLTHEERMDPNSDLYRWDPSRSLTCYLLLQPDSTDDSFQVEVACSPLHKWPRFHRNDTAVGGASRFPISRLWAPEEPSTSWWLGRERRKTSALRFRSTDASRMLAIPGQVADCILRIQQNAIPYFLSVARKQSAPAIELLRNLQGIR